MSFIADKQTLDDLNLLGKYKPGSIYSLFNKVRTKGGERLLDDMFRHPLSDPEEINRRAKVFLYYQEKAITFPFGGASFSVVEDYLSGGASGNIVATMADVLRKRLMEAVVKDEAYGLVREGVRGAVTFLHGFRNFIGQFDERDAPEPLLARIGIVKGILNDPRLAGLLQDAEAATGQAAGAISLSWPKTASIHHLLTHVLQNEMTRLCEALYYFDLCIAVGNVAANNGLSYARALPEAAYVVQASDLRHPSLETAVGNPISLTADSNVLFLTGANMAGKSTLMKSFGIALYLAHMGFPVAASDMIFSIRDGLYSSINVPDSLTMGYSHFYAEVRRVKTIAEAVSQSKSLVVIFDELFKGTNVKDAYDATLAVTAAFAEYRNCSFIISTHIIEVGETLRTDHANLQFAYLPTVMQGNTPKYTYRLKEGITSDRHGMMIIENEKIIEIIKIPFPRPTRP
jgi:DNA mismatch repair ATPase MutS